jgi:HNH endonuclease
MIRLLKRKPMQPSRDVACAQCGKVFAITPSRLARSKRGLAFCSNACSAKHHSETHSEANAQCQYCGKVFHRSPANFHKSSTHAYCGRVCYDKARSEGIAEVRKPVDESDHPATCTFCGKTFVIKRSPFGGYRPKKYCSKECQRQSHITTGSYIPRAVVLKQQGGSCEMCSCLDVSILEVHHKDRNRSNNKLDNLILLCPNCHTKLHRIANRR